jgi:plasmid stabilization system protein ParE
MPGLKWSKEAAADIQRLYRFLADVNPDAAKRAALAIKDGVKILQQFPEIGRPVIGMSGDFRDWLIHFGGGGYVARYHLDGQNVTIVLVRHQRELL